MTPKSDREQRVDKSGRATPLPETDQRRLYRPEDAADERRVLFTDWASI